MASHLPAQATLREEIEQLRQSAAVAHSRAEDVAALAGCLARLEGHLAREQARAAEAQAETERLSQLLTEERHAVDALRQELRTHPSSFGV